MTLHAIKNSSLVTNFDFVNNPVLFTSNSTGTVNISATSYGAALNASGKRIWNQAALALNSTNTLLSGQNVTIPFIVSNLPAEYFDAIVLLTVDGVTRLPYAFSNSSDNTEPSTLASNKILYWADLYCFGLNNNLGNNNTANNYMFGGTGQQMEANINYKINFSEPLVSPLSYTWQIRYISYTLGLNPYVLSGTTTAPINSLFSTYFSGNIVTSFNNNGGGIPYQTAGYFELSIVVADTNYRSLLKKYHWGCS
jgi:hypothetical protein